MNNCVFCSIIKGEIPSKKVYEDDIMLIFEDIDPKAEKHYLAVSKKHYAFIEDMDAVDKEQIAYMLSTVAREKDRLGLSNGYRLIINQGKDAGQTVFHLHIHIMGGQELPFPDMRAKV